MRGVRARPLCACLLALAAALLAAAPAGAATRTLTYRSATFTLGGFEVESPKVDVPSPGRTGYVTRMDVRLVDPAGRPVTIRRVMLHHVVFINAGRWRTEYAGSCPGRYGEPFYGTGEENQRLVLPPGHGYLTNAGDRWRLNAMLMSHTPRTTRVRIEYRLRFVTGQALQHVRPFWIRVNGCDSGTGGYSIKDAGSPDADRTWTWKMPISGRIVAAGGHLHGGALNMTLSQPRCENRELLDTRPLYAPPDDIVYRVRPVLHEPGPVATRYFLSRKGIPVRAGMRLRLRSTYDATRPRARVMSIMHVYVAPGPEPRAFCPALPDDAQQVLFRTRGTTTPPFVPVRFNWLDDAGRMRVGDELPGRVRAFAREAEVDVRDNGFFPARISLPVGGRVTWRFRGTEEHNVLYAGGPRVIGTSTLRRGTVTRDDFTVPGRYQLFCYLHPLTMHQEVVVREPEAAATLPQPATAPQP